jgi:hypothetical protein
MPRHANIAGIADSTNEYNKRIQCLKAPKIPQHLLDAAGFLQPAASAGFLLQARWTRFG